MWLRQAIESGRYRGELSAEETLAWTTPGLTSSSPTLNGARPAFGARATAPALFSVALMDEICPPSTVYAAFHAYGGAKGLRVYPFNDHEGGQTFQEAAQLEWLAPRFRAPGRPAGR